MSKKPELHIISNVVPARSTSLFPKMCPSFDHSSIFLQPQLFHTKYPHVDASRLQLPRVLRRSQTGETLTDEERKILEYFTKRIELVKSRCEVLRGVTDDKRGLGKVAFYAGFPVTKGFRQDWALVEVKQGRIGLNGISPGVL